MSMSLSVYIGPYLVIEDGTDFDIEAWEDCVCEGRGEKTPDDESTWLVLVPNRKLEGIDRPMRLDADYLRNTRPIMQISPENMEKELAAFNALIATMKVWCDRVDIDVEIAWGVVPGVF